VPRKGSRFLFVDKKEGGVGAKEVDGGLLKDPSWNLLYCKAVLFMDQAGAKIGRLPLGTSDLSALQNGGVGCLAQGNSVDKRRESGRKKK